MGLRSNLISTVALFGSFSTLICCALPILFVSLGAGAVVAGLVSAVPQIVWLSEHKVPLFIFAGIMLVLSGISCYLARNAPCPVDPAQAKACMRMRRLSLGVFIFSVVLYAIGFFAAFIAYKFI